MEKLISYSTENCIICSEFMGAFRNELTVVTGYSEKQIYELIGKRIEIFQNLFKSDLFRIFSFLIYFCFQNASPT